MNTLEKVLRNENIGFFQCIELYEIIGFIKDKQPFNIFTIAIAQELSLPLIQDQRITDKPQEIKKQKGLKFGIFKSILSIDDFLKRIDNLSHNHWGNSQGKSLSVGQFRALPVIYVPSSSNPKNDFLGLLKNNFFSGSHVFEWFDESKEYVKIFLENHHALEELSETLQKFLPIKIASHSDRLGNFILQIPCCSVSFSMKCKDRETNHLISYLAINPNIENEPNLTGVFGREQHGSIIDFQKKMLKLGENYIPFQHINGTGYYTIWDEENQIVCAGGKITGFVENIVHSIFITEYQERIFTLNGKENRVSISTQASQQHIDHKKDYRDWVSNKLIKTERQELKKNLQLTQFKAGMRQEALELIRALIKSYGKNGVYLWDPYLNATDLLETVFYTPYAYVPIKALTGLKVASDQHTRHSRLKRFLLDIFMVLKRRANQNKPTTQKYEEELNQSIIEFGLLDLTFLNADKSLLGDFHDRFLIFPKTVDTPAKAWSLGTSVNSLGTSHHIVQEVADGQIIADIFEEMWNVSIKKTENIIWQSKK
ncbi:VPA1262 family N-terminal domain-containing protein [Actinobacillus porcinus]|uniref:VPA1262 family N-terminal domain-containing protein n=1 Tax=Actinobacillus porcinus TaxID=51048 RepID=UPI002A90ECD9|nr:VPA1262 family N-terminal domain-containing protein [Actinobacillus porcinus]MDY6215268.1 VPA1262 family N-terminal domain-containing protein [Actinobacillus porcinus]